MRHTDVLLKLQSTQPEDLEAKKAKVDQLRELQQKSRVVYDLNKSEGWQVFVQELAIEEKKILALIERSNDPTTMAKLAGSLLVIKSFQSWPADVVKELDAAAKDLEKDED